MARSLRRTLDHALYKISSNKFMHLCTSGMSVPVILSSEGSCATHAVLPVQGLPWPFRLPFDLERFLVRKPGCQCLYATLVSRFEAAVARLRVWYRIRPRTMDEEMDEETLHALALSMQEVSSLATNRLYRLERIIPQSRQLQPSRGWHVALCTAVGRW